MGRYVPFDKPAKSSVKNSVETVTVQFWYAKHLKNKNLISYTYSSFSLLQMDSKNNQYQFWYDSCLVFMYFLCYQSDSSYVTANDKTWLIKFEQIVFAKKINFFIKYKICFT